MFWIDDAEIVQDGSLPEFCEEQPRGAAVFRGIVHDKGARIHANLQKVCQPPAGFFNREFLLAYFYGQKIRIRLQNENAITIPFAILQALRTHRAENFSAVLVCEVIQGQDSIMFINKKCNEKSRSYGESTNQ